MKIGTKSVLFGAHCFFIHPVFVFMAWWKLYGFPFDPRLWVAFFVHDLGYLRKPNMDGPEGETHVELGAKIMSFLFDDGIPSDLSFSDNWKTAFKKFMIPKRKWYNFSLYHSRFYAKKDGVNPSKLCAADKLAICLEPSWLYLPRVTFTGEIKEYMKHARIKEGDSPSKYGSMNISTKSKIEWFRSVQNYLRLWVNEHKDGKTDTWTPETKQSINASGVWQ